MVCEICYIEDYGEDFDFVWWGDGGMEVFDYDLIGYVLEGAHREVVCRDCY